ncbi:hypothetical protein TPMD03_16 [Thiohalocapsa phage LS06-2018-MD03]|nr:hypothetical protein TPMD03_16 [Thiohalocapsa phage LS06-2018-MD03]
MLVIESIVTMILILTVVMYVYILSKYLKNKKEIYVRNLEISKALSKYKSPPLLKANFRYTYQIIREGNEPFETRKHIESYITELMNDTKVGDLKIRHGHPFTYISFKRLLDDEEDI